MHELAITESVVASVRDRLGDARVLAVTLEIGRLSGVVADSVRFCFDLCTEGTPLQGARLDIVDVPGGAYCRGCRSDVELVDLIPLCPCGSADLDITSGQELMIRQVEVA
ncbi:hydrogenase maturation nickel metallochaperone HypA/HybF [Longispora fulva]|uniref:Hydrogenase maturation factor HypA n=1 Tax=Longispora fulva TaxID=619741 RepID=A0A8J7GDP2_9ACTN|nr:hydrogenase maturation nickel metallochaperone HypA [Longispora fulva]MBG6136779.1 hydrogenase nickel incorporation protein HypA/HybF [Longispora fulva]